MGGGAESAVLRIGYAALVSDDPTTAATVTGRLHAAPVAGADDKMPVVAGYELVRLLGRGGMGVVWEAIEQKLDRAVALKVHRQAAPDELAPDALWTEALVAARIGDPSIVRVLDVGYTLDERPYYAMELVSGTDLGALIADGPLAPRKALAIAADMTRAAAAAHRLGVIHRDLKPRNVIIDGTGRARVCDFGIAFDTRRGGDPLAGLIAGSPPYMAPEQALGEAITPQTDIWAIGVILYEMLTGARPFAGATLEDLLAQIIAVDPPPPSAKRDGIHADLDAIVMRCLNRSAPARFASAVALFETLSAIAEGQRVEIDHSSLRPYVPKRTNAPPPMPTKPRREEATKHLSWSWTLRAPPEALWPHVADTDRFNKAVGLAPVQFTDEVGPDGPKRTGHLKVLGMVVTWREYPFEWVRAREHAVFRSYTSGPIGALWNKVTLVPREDGGTELHHDIWLTPRGVLGQVAAFVELDRKLGSAVDRFYRHLDEVVARGASADPFEPPHEPKEEARLAVDAVSAKLRAQGFDPALVARLGSHLLTAPDGVIGTLRPYQLADAWGTERGETVDVFIHAAQNALLEPVWDVICPKCMIAHESVQALQKVKRHGSCTACATSFERDLRETVELVFAPHPSVRTAPRETFCAGSPARRPHVLVQQVIEPGETRRVTVDLPRGTYQLAGTMAKIPWELVSSAVGFEDTCEVTLEGDRIEGRPAIVKAGAVDFVLQNTSDVEETVRIEIAGFRDDAVSAAAALTHPSFRAFFSKELLAHGEHVRVRHMAFVFVELASRDQLFDQIGDGEACAALARLEEVVVDVARGHEGDVVPSSIDVLVVGFPTSLRAVRAALAIRERLAASKLASPAAIAVHDGRCIALTRSGKPEFFGETLHRGQTLLRDCPGGGLALSASVMSDRAVAVAVHESQLSVAVDQTREGPYAGRRVTLLLP